MDTLCWQYPLDLNLPPVTMWLDDGLGLGRIFGYIDGDMSVCIIDVTEQPIKPIPDTAIRWCPDYTPTSSDGVFYLDIPRVV